MKVASVSASCYSPEAEQQVLGAVLAVNDRFHDVSSFLKPEHFCDPVHADIWQNLAGRISKDHLASPITVATDLSEHVGLPELGGKTYLNKLVASSISGFDVVEYARMVVDLHGRRHMAGRLEQISGEVRNGRSADEAAAELELMLHEREENNAEPRTMSFIKAQTRSLKQMVEIKDGKMIGVPTGMPSLDEVVSLAPKRYTILGGSTSMGKTGLALSISLAAAKAGYGVGFVTLEMPEEDLANRINSAVSEIPYKAYDRPMSENSFRKVIETAHKLESLPLEIFSERVRDVPSILSEGKKLQRKMKPNDPFKGFKLLVVDYIQLVRGRGQNDFAILSRVANDLKQVAKALNVHVLALAQIDRNLANVDHFSEARPNPSHLRGSGDLENAPDNVMFVFRPEYYLKRQQTPKKDDERADWEADLKHWANKAEIIIAKARMGEICSVTVGCDMATNRFFDLPDRQDDMGF
ncbi:MAG: AAA family ATPase [Colwellia sp.]|nr:AAA family ATPase [Colwellia sp.]